ncbi:MAG: hypothetical protein IJ242_05025 [Clostridia bacterium]|nr:hypothetical protein [Clostridia bacterium]
MKIGKWLLLWGILIAAVCLYSLPERDTWTFLSDSLSQIAETRWRADTREKAFGDMMNSEKVNARLRTDSGIWGAEETEIVWEPYMPAVDPDGGLNLLWGKYDIIITAAPGTKISGSVVSAGYQSFIEDGIFSGVTGSDGKMSSRFTLTDTAFQVFAAFDSTGNSIESITIRKEQGFLSPDAVAVGILIGIAGSVLMFVFERAGSRPAVRRDALTVLGIAVFASMPLLWGGLYDGHDLLFHLNRIEGIASGLRCGQFPVRIHASTLLGFGYAASVFYPEAFLYLPAVMRNFGVSLSACVQIFLGLINLMTVIVCYFSAKKLLRDSGMTLGATMLYTLNPYRLVNLYTRATLGESQAMIFFPLLIVAMAELLTGDDRRWPLLTAAMLGIFLSHLLSTLFSVVFCVLAVLIYLPQLLHEKRRIGRGILAAALTALCSLWFLVPMVMYSRSGISTYVGFDSWLHALDPGGLLVGFAGGTGTISNVVEDFSYTVGVVPGFALMLGAALSVVNLCSGVKEIPDRREHVRLIRICLAFSGIALFTATRLFPWKTMCTVKGLSMIFHQIQFPWRFVGVATPFLALAGAWGYMSNPRMRQAGIAIMAVLCILTGGYVMQHVVEEGPILRAGDVSNTRQDQFEYMYPYTEKEALEAGSLEVRGLAPYTITDYRKRGSTLSFSVEVEPGEFFIEAPLLYYPGYEAYASNGEIYKIDRGMNNVIRIRYPSNGEKTEIHIRYTEPVLWRICEVISLVSIAGLAVLLIRQRRWK